MQQARESDYTAPFGGSVACGSAICSGGVVCDAFPGEGARALGPFRGSGGHGRLAEMLLLGGGGSLAAGVSQGLNGYAKTPISRQLHIICIIALPLD